MLSLVSLSNGRCPCQHPAADRYCSLGSFASICGKWVTQIFAFRMLYPLTDILYGFFFSPSIIYSVRCNLLVTTYRQPSFTSCRRRWLYRIGPSSGILLTYPASVFFILRISSSPSLISGLLICRIATLDWVSTSLYKFGVSFASSGVSLSDTYRLLWYKYYELCWVSYLQLGAFSYHHQIGFAWVEHPVLLHRGNDSFAFYIFWNIGVERQIVEWDAFWSSTNQLRLYHLQTCFLLCS